MTSYSDEVDTKVEDSITVDKDVKVSEDGENVTFSAMESVDVKITGEENAENDSSIYPTKDAANNNLIGNEDIMSQFLETDAKARAKDLKQRKGLLIFFSVVLPLVFVGGFLYIKFAEPFSSSDKLSNSTPLGVDDSTNTPTYTPTLAPTFPKLSYDIIPIGEISDAENIFSEVIAEESDVVDGALYYFITGGRKALVSVYKEDCKTKIDEKIINAKPIYGPIAEGGIHIYFALFFFVDFEIMPFTDYWRTDNTFRICSRIDLLAGEEDGLGDLDGDGVVGGIGDSVTFHKTKTTWTVILDGGVNTGVEVNGGSGIEAVFEDGK